MKLKTKKPRNKLFTMKLNEDELCSIRDKAETYTAGCMTKWVRYSAIHLDPNQEDLEEESDGDSGRHERSSGSNGQDKQS